MKTRIIIKNLGSGLAVLFFMMLSVAGHSQACPGNQATVTLQNIAQTNSTTVEFDVYISNTGTNTMRLNALAGAVIYNVGSFPQSPAGTVSFTCIEQPSTMSALHPSFPNVVPAWTSASRQLRWSSPPIGVGNAVTMPPNTPIRFARFRAVSSVPFTENFSCTLTMQYATQGGYTNVNPIVYCNGNTTNSTNLTSAFPTGGPGGGPVLITHDATNSPYTLTLSPPSCATVIAASNLGGVTCFGGSDGSATITLSSPTPANATVSYTVDGGSAQSASLVSGSFNVTGLAAGARTIAVTYPSCSAISTVATIPGPSGPLTNTTTESACGSYLWSVTGTTYNESGTYTGTTVNGNGCTVNETLNLTITPNTTNGSMTQSACDSYTWTAGNGTTYTESGVYTHTVGCNTATLTLTITPSTTNGNLTETACGSYTWTAGNGTTYTESGVYTHTVGCNTATLTLTITPSTTNGSMTQSACGSYTWTAGNGTTYTESGVYTHTVGCNTATLTLTITPNTTNGSMTQSACDSYTWTAGNGTTYTESGVYTHTVGCNTATLTLTITPSTTNGNLTETACGSYTWTAGNGQTYTESGVYTHVTGCNTATLTLTINASSVAYYADTDGDGFGAGAPTFSCTGNPGGMVLNNTDCAPADASAWQFGNFYVDADNDGYYNGNPEATQVCYGNTVPSGYTASITGTDCDDANANANPNHVEIAGNTIDDNCDGTADEVGPAIVIIVSQCGTTLSNVASTIYSNQAAGAQGYRFEVTNGANVRTYDSATNSFSLTALPGGVAYGTTYAIRVAVKTNGFWRAYSTPCNITTPAQPATTNVVASQCGVILPNMSTLIYANQVTAANQYRFEVTNGANVRIYETSVNRFALTNLAGGGVYGTTYSVRVALRFGTTWEGYGTACNVTAPATPGISSLIASQCGITINNRWTTLYANQIADAQGYRFEVTNGATVRYYNTSVNRFALANLAGGVAPSTVYTVRVAVLYNSVYGDFGPSCNVTTAGVITRQAESPVTVFTVKSFPNPFADTFKLEINTSSEENVSVKVYDMIGKLVESRDIKSTEIGTQEVGSRFSSGVYNVIVSQGANVETLRVIKR